jgi:hypothetical protein
MRSVSYRVLDMVEMRRVLVGGNEECESLICSPSFDKTVIPHAECVWVNVDILEWDRVRDHLL